MSGNAAEEPADHERDERTREELAKGPLLGASPADDEMCLLNDMPKRWCSHCRREELPKPEPLQWFPAMYSGTCAACGRPIEPGDEIAKTDDGYICRRRHS